MRLGQYGVAAGVIGAAAIGIQAGTAFAASPVGNVGTAKATEGAFSAEIRTGYTDDPDSDSLDGRLLVRQHVDYGVTDWYAVRVVTAQRRNDGGEYDYTSTTFENRVQLFEADRDGFDGGFRVIYVHRDGDDTPNEIDVRLMAMGSLGEHYSWRHNTVLEHDVGANASDGVALEFRNQITRKLDLTLPGVSSVSAGIEMFNDFGRLRDTGGFDEADHQFGPVAKANFSNGVYVQAGYRAGLSEDAPNHLAKVFLGKRF